MEEGEYTALSVSVSEVVAVVWNVCAEQGSFVLFSDLTWYCCIHAENSKWVSSPVEDVR